MISDQRIAYSLVLPVEKSPDKAQVDALRYWDTSALILCFLPAPRNMVSISRSPY